MLTAVKTGDPVPEDEFSQEVVRLLASQTLQGAETLRNLLRYLSDHTLQQPNEHVKEYQLATEVFGRHSEFDPQTDATVRVQVRRLRVKLAQYYETEGADDPILVEIPKGGYAVTFRRRPSLTAVLDHAPADPNQADARDQASTHRSLRPWRQIAATVLVLCLAVAVIFVRRMEGGRSLAPATPLPSLQSAPEVERQFWKPFINGSEEPWVVFSNAEFVGRPETGMRYFQPGTKIGDEPVTEHYTGVGEVLGVLDLDRLFLRLGRTFRAKRAHLFTLDDAQNSNLIFIGSPAEDPALVQLGTRAKFIFQRVASGVRKGDLGIADVAPSPGQPRMFLPSPPNRPLSVDYAVISLTRGINEQHSTLLLAGTTTIGTEAAVDFVCQPNSLSELLQALHLPPAAEIGPFEAVLRVKIEQDVPVATELVAINQ
ncbi:MAG: hypothetical protein ROO76_01440 [Terriglobia bacterium]|jgi:hypothetical protein|nr:hypothetical protein [Terriglobia bacterium]